MDGNEDEGDICRVCRIGASPDRPLNYPCKCSGSIRFIHQDCLLMWLTHSKTKYCELCGHQFEFTPIYADNTPTVLPPHEIFLGLLKRATVGLRGGLRLTLVMLSWFVIVPLATSFTFYMYFGRPAYEFSIRQLRFSYPSVLGFMTDCAFGTFISAVIIFLCLLIMSLMDFVNNMHVMEHNRVPEVENQNNNQNNNQNLNNLNNIQPNGNNINENEGRLADVPDPEEVQNEENDGEEDQIAQYNEVLDQINNLNHPEFHMPPPAPAPGPENAGAGVGADVVEDDDGVINNMLFGFLDGNAGEVDFNELIGVAGPLAGLISKVIALILFNACFLALFAKIPLVLGRFVLQIRNQPIELLRTLTERVVPESILNFDFSFLTPDSATVATNISAVENVTFSVVENATSLITENLTAATTAQNTTEIIENVVASIETEPTEISALVGDLDAVFVGYLFIAAFCLIWIGITLSLTANFVRSRNPLYRTVQRTLKLVLTAVKVACVMFSELVVFPLLVGIALDGCTVNLFGSSISSRLAFWRRSPLLFQMVHWCVGFAYMIFFASFVGWVREVVRPGVLWFFRDPSDPNFNPLKDIVEHPASRHVKRLLMSVFIYGVIIGLLVFLPIIFGKHFWSALFPLNIWLGDPFYEGPIDLIFVHVIVPYTLEYCHPRANFKALLRWWIEFVSNKLGITDYMLPEATTVNQNAPANVNPIPNLNLQGNPNLPVNLNHAPVVNQAEAANQPVVYKPPHFGWRVFVLLNLAWLSMFIVNSALVSIPIVLGRFLFAQLAFPLTNDLYTFCAGFYALYGVARVSKATVTFMTSLPLPQIASEIALYTVMGAKCAIAVVFLGGIIPLFIGLVFELVVAIPWRVASDQSPHFFLYQDWGLGLIYLKVWYRIIVARADHIRQHPARAHLEGFDLHAITWKAKFDQIFQDGIRNLHLGRIFTSLVFPLLDRVLIMLCVPYAFSKGVAFITGSLFLSSITFRFSYLVFAVSIALAKLRRPLIHSFRTLHNAIRDDKYLVGKQLHNYTTAMS